MSADNAEVLRKMAEQLKAVSAIGQRINQDAHKADQEAKNFDAAAAQAAKKK